MFSFIDKSDIFTSQTGKGFLDDSTQCWGWGPCLPPLPGSGSNLSVRKFAVPIEGLKTIAPLSLRSTSRNFSKSEMLTDFWSCACISSNRPWRLALPLTLVLGKSLLFQDCSYILGIIYKSMGVHYFLTLHPSSHYWKAQTIIFFFTAAKI